MQYIGAVSRRLHGFSLCLMLTASGIAFAGQETSHYPPGAEGLKIVLPPPGVYLAWYNVGYTTGTVRDGHGDKIDAGLDLDIYASVPRLFWLTEHKFLGADYGMDIAMPLLTINMKSPGASQTKFGLGDILIEPVLLAWHFERWDLGAAAGAWFPTGNFSSAQPVNLGKGFWTGMFSFASTYFFDAEKTWYISSLMRYETNSAKLDKDVRPGDDFHIEWGLGTDLTKHLHVGITAYTHWQVSNDQGSAVNYNANVHDRLYAVGPEVQYIHPPSGLFFSLRYQKELGVVDRTEGHKMVLSIIKSF